MAVDEQQVVRGDNGHGELIRRKCQLQIITMAAAGVAMQGPAYATNAVHGGRKAYGARLICIRGNLVP